MNDLDLAVSTMQELYDDRFLSESEYGAALTRARDRMDALAARQD